MFNIITAYCIILHRMNSPYTLTRSEVMRYAAFTGSFGFAPGLGLKDAKGMADNPGKVGPVLFLVALICPGSWLHMKTQAFFYGLLTLANQVDQRRKSKNNRNKGSS